jgi:hypothetical protein
MSTPPASGLPDRPIHDEFADWAIEPIGIGWTATQTTGNGRIHVVAAPTIRELRLKLREVTSREGAVMNNSGVP